MGHTGTELKQDRGFPGLRIETGGTQQFWFDLQRLIAACYFFFLRP